jgi:hypothetical protein
MTERGVFSQARRPCDRGGTRTLSLAIAIALAGARTLALALALALAVAAFGFRLRSVWRYRRCCASPACLQVLSSNFLGAEGCRKQRQRGRPSTMMLGRRPSAVRRKWRRRRARLDLYPHIEQKSSRTTDVRNTIQKPMTVPDGWVNTPIVADVAKVWYNHKYHREGQIVQAPWEEGDRCSIC